jgi:hypothetical protein
MHHTNQTFPTTTTTMNNNFDKRDVPTVDDTNKQYYYYYDDSSLLQPNPIESSLSAPVSFSLIPTTVNPQNHYDHHIHLNEMMMSSTHPVILNTLTLEPSSYSTIPTTTRSNCHHHVIQADRDRRGTTIMSSLSSASSLTRKEVNMNQSSNDCPDDRNREDDPTSAIHAITTTTTAPSMMCVTTLDKLDQFLDHFQSSSPATTLNPMIEPQQQPTLQSSRQPSTVSNDEDNHNTQQTQQQQRSVFVPSLSIPADPWSSPSSSASRRRRGDQRMNRAIVARLHNPQLKLQEALIIGGFRFPTSSSAASSFPDATRAAAQQALSIISTPLPGNHNNILHHTMMDDENVTLGQRKNQLSRRLRLLRQQTQLFNNRT